MSQPAAAEPQPKSKPRRPVWEKLLVRGGILVLLVLVGVPLTAVLLNDARGTGHKAWDVSLTLPASMCREGAILRIRPTQDHQPWETTIALREDVHTYRVGLLMQELFSQQLSGTQGFPRIQPSGGDV